MNNDKRKQVTLLRVLMKWEWRKVTSLTAADADIEVDKNVSGEGPNEERYTGTTTALLALIWKAKILKSVVALIISKNTQ